MQEKIKNMLGFAIRGKKYSIGETVIQKVSKGRSIKLALIANDASELTKKKYSDKLSFYKIQFLFFSSKEELGDLLHKNEISVFAIEDINIAKQVIKLIKEGD